MAVKYVGVKRIEAAQLESNALNANVEDGATYNRLKHELEKNGMLELPLALELENGSYRILSGHHRVRAWVELGHASVDTIVVAGKLTKEEEFNVVNNLNMIRGQPTLSTVKRVIRAAQLDPSQLDLFKFPVTKLLPNMDRSGPSDTLMRRARIRDMALKLAHHVAESLLDQKDEAVVCFRVEDKPVAVVRLAMKDSAVRANIAVLKRLVQDAVDEWVYTKDSSE